MPTSKVAPLGISKKQKTISLPRLELSGALLLSHLFQKVKQSLKVEIKCYYWVDSTIVLHWLAGTPSRWKTFVANRVSEIQHLTRHGIWRHVAGLENPADIISRGMLPTQLKETDLWWYGPTWLQQTPRFWPSHIRTSDDEFVAEDLEERSIALPIQVHTTNPIISLRSSFPALVRLVALLRRFGHNSRPANRQHRKIGFIQAQELQEATNTLVRIAQAESFQEDLRSLTGDGQVKSNSKLKNLRPIMVDGILRIGGRLRNAPVSEDRKHPIILGTHHPLTELIITSYHQRLLHAGPQLLISSVREKFWPLRVRNLARKVVHSCVKCCKTTVSDQMMEDLPVGGRVDLCGPLFYRYPMRKSKPVKCYVAIFVCLATKAIHIELVADLSTAAFIAALKRFVGRRGRPAVIECDNAKNFVGASRTLADLMEQFRSQQHKHAVTTYCGEEGIFFKFIPPRSPNFGGLWEAAVRSFKKHFKTTIGTTVLLKDDLETVLVQIESCLNSRPLTQLTSEPEDLEILTPGHFLVHRPLVSIPEPSYENVPTNRLDRYQHTQEFVRRIWKRWSTDYLSGLHPRTKWTRLRDNISIGTMVLLKDDNLPPLKWHYGRVTQIFVVTMEMFG
ncbi:uncharacterized protein LOC134223115 [Armigeres subalbatus]|uniref:uncharacterized protein LOC134223115 n=1 Tax=Armigeres subalbatus TaxID=124917 RepID=UPI002ECFE35A